ncbi:hypothetical protein ERJ75_000394000 [Trypanosoma vivax]|nr:hypothetical protein ERJ75_000394000 [Trypanosoma vivax]
MFAVAFVLFLLGNGCVRDARCQNEAVGTIRNNGDYYACCEQNRGDGPPALLLDDCSETKGSDGKHNINCTGGEDPVKGGFANFTGCTFTGDTTVIFTGCSVIVIDSHGYNITGPVDIFVSKCFADKDTHDVNKCGIMESREHHRHPNCTEVLSDYQK